VDYAAFLQAAERGQPPAVALLHGADDGLGKPPADAGIVVDDAGKPVPKASVRLTSAGAKNDYGKFCCGIAIAPTNTAALNTQETTSGAFKVFIKCL